MSSTGTMIIGDVAAIGPHWMPSEDMKPWMRMDTVLVPRPVTMRANRNSFRP
jgi:hypothetical protein